MKKPFALVVSPDRLEASLRFESGCRQNTVALRSLILSELKMRRITYGVDLNSLDTWLSEEARDDKLVLARGKPPVHGQDAQIDLCTAFNSSEVKPITVEAQSLLAVVEPPTAGENGVDVFGKTLPTKVGKEANLICGPNVSAKENGPNTEYYAQTTGLVSLIAGYRLSVFRKVEIQSDVDSMVGDLTVDGSLVVAGCIRSQVVIRASGDVICHGNIEDATIFAGGNLIVQGGIVGKCHCQVVASGHVEAAFVENADVAAKGDVIVQGGLVHSTITSQSSIIAQSVEGRLVGCQTAAHKSIVVRVLGSQAEIPTRVAVGNKACQRIHKTILQNRTKVLRRGLQTQLESNFHKSANSQRTQTARLKAQLRNTARSRPAFLLRFLKQAQGEPKIEVLEQTFPAVTMIIKGVGRFIDQMIEGHCLFYYDQKKDYVRCRSLPKPESKVAEELNYGSEQKESN